MTFLRVKHFFLISRFIRTLSTKYLQKADYNKLYQVYRDKIIYSSFIEKEQIAEEFKQYRNKKQHKLNLEKAQIKPFPSILKLLNEDVTKKEDNNIQTDQIKIETKDVKIKRNYPKSWMKDYEFYDETDEEHSEYGTSDPTIRPSQIPCSGCGANLHCADPGIPGYIPSEIFKRRTNDELKRIICQRCHFLKTYNIAIDVTVPPEKYIEIVSSLKDKFALAILMIDLLDFPCSIWPGIQEILGNKRPIFIVGNKVDILPKDSKGYLEYIQQCLIDSVIKAGLTKINIKHVCLISAKTGYGVEELITQLHNIWAYSGDVYLVGCTNVGKSSLFNALLRSDYCKVQASDLIQKATICPLPGTTLEMLKFPILRPSDHRLNQRFHRLKAERSIEIKEEKLRTAQLNQSGRIEPPTLIGHITRTFENVEERSDAFGMSEGVNPILTLNERSREYAKSRWCFDTPGVMHPEQILNLLTTEELLMLTHRKVITPKTYMLKKGFTFFLGGLGRLDFVSGDIDTIRITIYTTSDLPTLITFIESAEEIYKNLLGTKFLGVPHGGERLLRWPGLKSGELINITGTEITKSVCDILLSSAGWVGVNLPCDTKITLRVWTPNGRGIFVRTPSLIPYGDNLRGPKIRGTLAYNIGKSFILK